MEALNSTLHFKQTQTQTIDSDSICLKNGIVPGHVPLLTGIPIKTMTLQMRLKK